MDSNKFYNLFDLKTGEFIKNYIWDQNQPEIGFSITKFYPKDSKFFKPAVKQDGSDDSAVLLKVYIRPNDNLDELPVGLLASKISLYQIDNQDKFLPNYDFSDPNSPTEESLKKSSESFQPINLEEPNRFVFRKSTSTFFDTKKKIIVTGHQMLDHIYNEHCKTIASVRGIWLKLKIKSLNKLIQFLNWIGKVFLVIIPKLSGRKIENKYYNMLLEPFNWANPKGVQDQVNNTDLVSYDDLLKKINPFTFSIVASIILLLYVLYYKFCNDFLGIISFIKYNNDDQVFSVVIITFTVLFFNYMLPNLLLWILNQTIKATRKLSFLRFEL